MHEGGHGILDGVKKKKEHSHDHSHSHSHDHHQDGHNHKHKPDVKAKLIAGSVAGALIIAFVVWKFLV